MNKIYNKLWSINQETKNKLKEAGDLLRYLTSIIFITYSACFLDNHTSRIFVISLGIALLLMEAIKWIFNNPRPREWDDNPNNDPTDNPDLDLDWSPKEGNSFISGHVTGAMYGGLWWFIAGWEWGILGVLLGVVTAISRIVVKAHWIRDVVCASVLSLIVFLVSTYYFL